MPVRTVRWMLTAFLLAGFAGAQQTLPVEVQNFPEVQRIEGPVRVVEPVPHASFTRIVDVTVPPGELEDTIDLVTAGLLDVDGYTEVTLSLLVVAGDLLPRPGTVRALLVPEDPRLTQVLEQFGEVVFPLEVSTEVAPGEGLRHFDSEPTRHPLAFPRYRVMFHNGAPKTVTVSLFVYLTN